MTAEERREKEFEQAANGYLWGDYVNAGTEFEEVEAFVKLLKKTWEAGRTAGIEEAAQVANDLGNQIMKALAENGIQVHPHGTAQLVVKMTLAGAIRALGKQEK